MSFVARYTSTCRNCKGFIHDGDEVTYEGDSVIHLDCEDLTFLPADTVRGKVELIELPVLGPKEVVCTTCFVVKPCECDD